MNAKCPTFTEPISKLEKVIAHVQRDERCVQRMAWVMDRLLILALAGLAYGVVLDNHFPYNGSELVFKVLCEVVLASVISLVGFAVLLTVYRSKCRKLKRLRDDHQLITRRQESLPGRAIV